MKKTKNTFSRACHLAAGMVLGVATGSLAIADDTEILVGNQLDPGNPNITFIIDTSGSMESEVVVGLDYDPQVTYEGICDTERFYWTQEGTGTIRLPDCAFNSYVNKSAYKCQSGERAIALAGRFRDRHAQWDVSLEPNSWGGMTRVVTDPDLSGAARLTDCAADAGVHGDIDGDYYPANGASGPWTTDPDLGIDWPTSGDLYTFYGGNYLNWIQQSGPETVIDTRMEVVQKVARDVLTPLTNVNIALMRFSTNGQGGMVLHEMVPIGEGGEEIVTAIDSLSPQGATPLAETLYEARQYYAGGDVFFGETSVGDGNTELPSVAASQNANGTYNSPIVRQCQRNYVVLLTDGLPSGDTDANTEIQGLAGPCDGNCLDEMAAYLDQADLRDVPNLPGPQSVQTFTIGFHTDQSLLEDAATGLIVLRDANGEPIRDENGELVTRRGYFIANSQQELTMAFEDIIDSIQTDGETFTAPALSVDVQNRLTNREDLYFTIFQPSSEGQPHWDGNLKKYRIGRAAGAGGTTIPTVLDVNSRSAVDENGLFVSGSHSYWSLLPDEGDVTSGGFTGTLTANRNIYTNVSGSILTAGVNEVSETNLALTAAMLEVDPTERDALLKWARGLNADGTVRAIIGDPLHSTPVLLTYTSDRQTLFFGTNDGYLHAIDPVSNSRGVTDIERFAFIPRELLPQLAELKRNPSGPQYSADKAYGLDGPITVWIDDRNNNGVIEGRDEAFLYVSMRRGGRNYYALDVSDINNPELAWSIIGGQGDFVELGQSWSSPIPSRVSWGGSERQVLFFAGGNDTNQDARDRPSIADDMGRAVYMVDARTGERLWWAGIDNAADLTLTEMTHSIPSDLRVFDVDQDGLDDRIYVGDTGGKVWRFDINNQSGTITGDVFADLGDAGEAGNRRFYSAPSVTRIFDEHFGNVLAIAIGSGHRAHPLERQVEDAFYLMRDVNVFAPQVDSITQQVVYPAPIVPGNLLDVTANATPSLDNLTANQGWIIDFLPGEKSLSAPVAVLDRIFFTTYDPAPPALTCQPVPVSGTGRLYSVRILSGAPLQADTPEPDDRFVVLDSGSIPPSPTLVFTPPPCVDCDADDPASEITMLVGTQALDPGILNVPRKTYWVQEDIDR